MRALKTWAAAALIALTTLALPSPTRAQRADGLTAAEAAQLFYNQNNPAAGLYRFHALHASWCVELDAASGFVASYFRQGWCSLAPERASFGQIAVIPRNAVGGRYHPHTLRSMAALNVNDGRLHGCATVARGVVFGPARIDSHNCDVPPGARDWGAAGGEDQVFRFRYISPGVFEIITPNSECWDVRDQSQNHGTDLIQWECNAQANQRFELTYLGPLPASEASFVQARGWRQGPDGLRRIWPLAGMDLPGGDYAGFETGDDNGAACAARCIDDAQCRAFTWVRPGVQGPSAMCYLKNTIPAPLRNSGETASSVIR